MASRRRRIVIHDDSSDEDSSIGWVTPPIACRRAVMPRTLYDDDSNSSSDSSESLELEGLLDVMKLDSPAAVASEDGSIERWLAGHEYDKKPAAREAPADHSASFSSTSSSGSESLIISNSGSGSGDEVSVVDQGSNDLEAPWNVDSQDVYYFDDSARDASCRWPKFRLPGPTFRKLFAYQATGVQWMGGLHHGGIGGILGDDMGMGKTFMAVVYISGLMKAGTIRNTLVVAPASVLRSWENEACNVLTDCVPGAQIIVLSSTMSQKKRKSVLDEALHCKSTRPHFVITTYGMVGTNTAAMKGDGEAFWDYIICDEAHTLKNYKTQASQSCHSICQSKTRRLMLTGTPIMNKLMELWCVFNWATSGKVLGPQEEYSKLYSKHIERARDKDASPDELEQGQQANKELQKRLAPYFLQRLKVDYLTDLLPQKTEFVVWVHLSIEQRDLYTKYLEEKATILCSGRSQGDGRLKAITHLQKLCGHPLLVSGNHLKAQMGKIDNEAIKTSCLKLATLLHLLSTLRSENHRILVFSESTKMLDVIEGVLASDVHIARIDGKIKESERQDLVDCFNNPDSELDVMLLSKKAAGVGLTLTGADRVILYDPSWTPAEDTQAVDRAYRIGQQREVFVYRLIAAGTVEEKMYERQIHKEGIRRTVFTSGDSVERYFEKKKN